MLKGLYYVTLICLVMLSLIIYISNKNLEKEVLSDKTWFSPTDIPSPSPTISLSPAPTRYPTPKPTFTPTPLPPVKKYTPQEINAFIDSYSGQYAVSPHVLRYIATCESGFNPLAHKNIYAGLFQFSISTWKTYRRRIGEDPDPDLRYDANEAVQTAAYVLSQGKNHIWPNCTP